MFAIWGFLAETLRFSRPLVSIGVVIDSELATPSGSSVGNTTAPSLYLHYPRDLEHRQLPPPQKLRPRKTSPSFPQGHSE